MASAKNKKFWNKSFWVTETPRGVMGLRTRSKVVLTILLFLFAGLIFALLIVIDSLESGRDIIMFLTLLVVLLTVVLILLVIIVSLIEYLRRFE